MGSREELHEELCTLLGTRNAYFQAPPSLRMQYDAIRYGSSGKDLKHANDKIYLNTNRYEGVIITKDPDSMMELMDKLLNHFEMCRPGTPYTAENLNHYPFTLYY